MECCSATIRVVEFYPRYLRFANPGTWLLSEGSKVFNHPEGDDGFAGVSKL